jgi:hypothetical protein
MPNTVLDRLRSITDELDLYKVVVGRWDGDFLIVARGRTRR